MQLNNPYANYNPSIPRPPSSSETSYIQLRPHVNQKPNRYNAGQRKQSHPYRKFQTGSTTTFSGYTNISNYHNKNNYHEQKQHNNNDNNMFHSKSSIGKKIPSLMSCDLFQEPPRKNRRKIQHAEQYKEQTLLHQNDINKHQNNNNNNYK